jgi:large repetitive protein
MRTLKKSLRTALSAMMALAVAVVTVPPVAHAAASSELLVHYKFDEAAGTVAMDSTGNGRNASVINGATWTAGEGLRFDGVDDYVKLPDNLMKDLPSITVSTEVLLAPNQSTPYFIYGLGNAMGSSGNGYLFTTGNNYRTSIASGNWSTEQTTVQNQPLQRGVWKTLTYTLSANTGTLYLDGVPVAQRSGITITPGSIGQGVTTANFIGKSPYSGDKYLKGQIRDFRIYRTALSPTEVRELTATDQERVTRDHAALSLGNLSSVTSNLTLPTSGTNGSSITWTSSQSQFISSTGVVTRPQGTNAQVTLLASISKGGVNATKLFTATVLRNATDEENVSTAATALALNQPNDVRGNITLPVTSGAATVSWTSSQPAVVDPTGVVTRQSAETQVTLTAKLIAGSASKTKNFNLTVKARPNLGPMEGYAFAYFTGNTITGENIYMAASRGNNALQWSELNGGQSILNSTLGTKGLRDPFLIRSPEGDKFFMIATDLSIGRGTSWDASQRQGSQYLEIWESTDLKTWSSQRHVKISPTTAGNTWAPEAYWDESQQTYVVFWASKLYAENDPNHTGMSYNRMLYATSRDFVTFSEAKIWQDRGESRIDSTVIKDKGMFYRFTKDEGGGGTGCSDIIQERASSLTAVDLPGNTSWTMLDSCIGRDAGTSAVEGPTVFKANPGDTSGSPYYLFVDEYGGRGYIPLGTNNLAEPAWKVPASYQLPSKPRHGTVIPVTKAELNALNTAFPPSVASAG